MELFNQTVNKSEIKMLIRKQFSKIIKINMKDSLK